MPIYSNLSTEKGDWKVSIISEKHDLTQHEIIIEVKNLLDYNRDFNLGFYLQSMNFDKSLVKNVYIYEWKTIAKEYPTYDVRRISKECFDNTTEKYYDCSYDETYQNGTAIKNVLDWKPTKMALITQADKVSAEYGAIAIPKLTSKEKYDDFGSAFDYNGTKRFKITWNTPIVKTEYGWGSSGYYAVYDKISGYDYDPWWDSNWNYCKNVTIQIYQTENSLPISKNITGLKLTNSYEGRLVNASCGNDGSEVNHTVKSSYVASASDDWVDIEFPFSGSANVTWSYYYGNPSAPDPAYYFLLFKPNFYSSCDWTNDWYSGDQAKYACGGGALNASKIDSGQFASDQLQTKNSYLSYGSITVWNIHYMTSASGNEYYTRFLTGTTSQGAWDNYYNVMLTTANKYRIYKLSPTMDNDTGVALQYQKNVSVKLHYNPTADTTALWFYNSTDSQLFNINHTSVPDVGYWGTWTDASTTGSLVRYYAFKIYFGFVNPRNNNLPTVTLGAEEEPPNKPPQWSDNSSSTPSVYSPTTTSNFQVKWTDDNDANGYNYSIFSSNCTGSWANYTTSRTGNYSYVNITMPACSNAGWKFYANDSSNVWNTTNTWYFTINKADSPLFLCFQNSTTTNCSLQYSTYWHITNVGEYLYEIYPNSVKWTAGHSGTSDYLFFRTYNGVNHSNVDNNTWFVYNATNGDSWGVNYTVLGNQNYSANYSGQGFKINKGTPAINITFNTSATVMEGEAVLINCNKPSELTVNLYNDTSSISNPYTFDTTGLAGNNFNFTCNTTGNANYSSATTNKSLSVTFLGGVYVEAFNEQNYTEQLTFNITVFNTTTSDTAYNQVIYQNNTISGDVTIYIWSSGYPQRNRYVLVPADSFVSFDTYLLSSAKGQYVSFYILDYAGNPVYNALVEARRLINNSWQVVDEEKTDNSGIATLFLDYETLHHISIEYGGTWYLSNSSLIPTQTLYRYYINPTNATNYTTPFTNLNITIYPQSLGLEYSTQNQTFMCGVYSSDSKLEYYGMNLTLPNGTSSFTNTTSSTGGTITKYFNLTELYYNDQKNISYDCFFKKQNHTQYDLAITYFIYNTSQANITSLEKAVAQARSLGFTELALGILSLIIAGVVGGFVGRFNSVGGGMITIVLLGFLWLYLGLFEIALLQFGGIYILVILTTVAIVYLKGGV